jgi:hypothetical protein
MPLAQPLRASDLNAFGDNQGFLSDRTTYTGMVLFELAAPLSNLVFLLA